MVIYTLSDVCCNNTKYPITDVLLGFMTSVMEINLLAYGLLKINIPQVKGKNRSILAYVSDGLLIPGAKRLTLPAG